MIDLHRVGSLIYNRPLVISPDRARIISDVYMRKIHGGVGSAGDSAGESVEMFPVTRRTDGGAEYHSPRSSRFHGTTPMNPATGRPMPYRVTADGTAIITIVGELVNRGAWIGASSGLVSYEGIKHQVAMARQDQSVKNVILDMESPGGEAIGAFDCAAAIRQLAKEKNVVAFVNGYAASGGYGLASAARRIISIPEGETGSIGVFMMHVDFSRMLANDGIKVTFVYSGDHKVEGNCYEELKPDVLARFQTEIDAMKEMFLQCVAAGRGSRFNVEAARATQALMYAGAEAKTIGMIDDVGTFEDLLVEMAQPDNQTVTVIVDGDNEDDSNDNGGSGRNASLPKGGDEMSLKQALREFIGLEEPSPKEAAAVPPLAAVMAEPAAAGEAAAASTEAPAAAEASAKPAVETPAAAASVAVGAGVHMKGEGETALCGVALAAILTDDIDTADCAACLRRTVSRSQVETEAQREQRIETEANAFASSCVNVGREATDALKARFVAAMRAKDEKALADVRSIAKAFPPAGPTERIGGEPPAPSSISKNGTDADIHFQALELVEQKGVSTNDPRFAIEYEAARAQITGGGNGAR